MIKYNTPQELFTAICDKIRDKTNSNELINHQDIPDKIDNLVDSDIINEYNSAKNLIMSNSSIPNIFTDDTIKILQLSFPFNSILQKINLPECTSIGSGYAFYNCTSLTIVDLPKCTSIGTKAFKQCINLTTVNLPECTSIDYGAFDRCTSLTTVNLHKCSSIDNYAFANCTSLTTIDLPECTSIVDSAFYGCTNLTTIILSSNQVVTLNNINAFTNSPIANGSGYIYVPDNLVDSYKTATNWSTYANRIKPISELPSELKEEYNL